MNEPCRNCSENNGEKCVPFFDVQNTMMHYNWANRRMLIALVCVCLSMIIVVIVLLQTRHGGNRCGRKRSKVCMRPP